MNKPNKRSERREEYERHRKEILDQFNDKMAALHMLYPEFKPIAASGDDNLGAGLTRVIRDAIAKRNSDSFTVRDVLSWLQEMNPVLAANPKIKVSVSNTLMRLQKKKDIEKTSPEGIRPAVYKRVV